MGRTGAVSFGCGVNSTAMLIGLWQRGVLPDLILFADTGGEKPETYSYIANFNTWLDRVGFPPVTVVRYIPPRAPYKSLEEACLHNNMLPSLAYGFKKCSEKGF